MDAKTQLLIFYCVSNRNTELLHELISHMAVTYDDREVLALLKQVKKHVPSGHDWLMLELKYLYQGDSHQSHGETHEIG